MMTRTWSAEEDEAILRMIGLGQRSADIAVHFGVSKNSILGRLHRLRRGLKPPKAPEAWSDEKKDSFNSDMMQKTETVILELLMHDNGHSAKEIGELVKHSRSGNGYVWEALIEMEKVGLVWRAHHFDWTRANRWEITGCGRIAQSLGCGQ